MILPLDRRRSATQLSYLVRGWPGHPLHPPLTAVTIGAYTAAVIAAVLYFSGTGNPDMAKATGFLLHVGILSSIPVAITGLIDWFLLPKHTPAWQTGLIHSIVTGVATVLFIVSWVGREETFDKGVIPTTTFVLILVSYAVMAFGGWLGGKLVFVFGYRVLAAEAPTAGEGHAS